MRHQASDEMFVVVGKAGDLSTQSHINCETLVGNIDVIECVCLSVQQGFEAFA